MHHAEPSDRCLLLLTGRLASQQGGRPCLMTLSAGRVGSNGVSGDNDGAVGHIRAWTASGDGVR